MATHTRAQLGNGGQLSPNTVTKQLQQLRVQDGEQADDELFDPRRGTYIPYGGFDAVIDDYYTQGDPADLKIPAPSMLERREQSRSPHRQMTQPSQQGQVQQQQVLPTAHLQQQQQQLPAAHPQQQQAQAFRQAGPPPPRPSAQASQDYYEDQRDYQEEQQPYAPYGGPPQGQARPPQQRPPQGYPPGHPQFQQQQRMMPRQGPPQQRMPPPPQQQQQQQSGPRPDMRMRQGPGPGQGQGQGYDPRMGPRHAYRPNGPPGPVGGGPSSQGYPPPPPQNNPGPGYSRDPRLQGRPPQAPGMRNDAVEAGFGAMPPPQQHGLFKQPSPAPSQTRSEHAGRVTSPPMQQAMPATAPTSQRNSARSEDNTDMLLHQEVAPPITLQRLNQLRRDAAGHKDPAKSLELVKSLMEAADILCNDPDPKNAKRSRDDYNREALRTLKQITAQEVPFPDAVFFLANCYGNGALALEVDHARAFAMYESAAKQRHAPSAYRTAVCLEIGAGTKPDVARAVRFYERAAEYGDVAAMYKLGMILLRGLLGLQQDPRTALPWLQKAADQATVDNPHALHELALLYEKGDAHAGLAQHEALAKDLFTKAAKLHYAPSQFRLGYAYEYGTLGCPVDPRRSIAWYSRGAERGDPESELALSGWYLTGSEGVLAQNDREAYLWGRKAAERGLAKAEFAVGYFYESGIGTAANVEEATKWYKRAATAGQKKAQERLLALQGKKPRR